MPKLARERGQGGCLPDKEETPSTELRVGQNRIFVFLPKACGNGEAQGW